MVIVFMREEDGVDILNIVSKQLTPEIGTDINRKAGLAGLDKSGGS
jgi:hypothetical protein